MTSKALRKNLEKHLTGLYREAEKINRKIQAATEMLETLEVEVEDKPQAKKRKKTATAEEPTPRKRQYTRTGPVPPTDVDDHQEG